MPRKKSETELQPAQATGAPAALAWIANQEADSRRDYELRKDELNRLIKRQQGATPADDGTDWAALIRQAEHNLGHAAENVQKWQKSLATFDKQIAPERREGDKIPVSEAREIYEQLLLCVAIAAQSTRLTNAQQAALCDSPEAFDVATAGAWQGAIAGAIQAAKDDNVIPAWLTVPTL